MAAKYLRNAKVYGVHSSLSGIFARAFTNEFFRPYQQRRQQDNCVTLYIGKHPFATFDDENREWIVLQPLWIYNVSDDVLAFMINRLRRTCPGVSWEDAKEQIIETFCMAVHEAQLV